MGRHRLYGSFSHFQVTFHGSTLYLLLGGLGNSAGVSWQKLLGSNIGNMVAINHLDAFIVDDGKESICEVTGMRDD